MDSEYTCDRCDKPLTEEELKIHAKYPFFKEPETGLMLVNNNCSYCKKCWEFINKHGATYEEHYAYVTKEEIKRRERVKKKLENDPVHQWLMKEEKLSDEQLAEIRRRDKLIFSEGTK